MTHKNKNESLYTAKPQISGNQLIESMRRALSKVFFIQNNSIHQFIFVTNRLCDFFHAAKLEECRKMTQCQCK